MIPVEQDVHAHVLEPGDRVADGTVGRVVLGLELHAEAHGDVDGWHAARLEAPGRGGLRMRGFRMGEHCVRASGKAG
ncbi:hypothetical protein GCM10027426_13870 [Microbacterium lacusdiani]